jgi:hypothetical protein
MKADLQMILTSLISLIVVFSIGASQHYRSYAEVKDKGSSNNPLVPIADNNNILQGTIPHHTNIKNSFP